MYNSYYICGSNDADCDLAKTWQPDSDYHHLLFYHEKISNYHSYLAVYLTRSHHTFTRMRNWTHVFELCLE